LKQENTFSPFLGKDAKERENNSTPLFYKHYERKLASYPMSHTVIRNATKENWPTIPYSIQFFRKTIKENLPTIP
jgi:hypothetical protein